MHHIFRWALVDLETTGAHVVQDKIIDIAIRVINQEGTVRTWSALIHPGRSIPPLITSLTGISNDTVKDAASFDEYAEELLEVLHDCVLVAHNARFDFGFLKNAFKNAGLSYKAPVLCTIKLMKALYPGLDSYNLASLADYFLLNPPSSYRADSDVDTLYQLIERCFTEHTKASVLKIAQSIHRQSSIPSKLTTDINAFPESAGVYLFYSSTSSVPIYIGKSVSLRQRIISHFQGDYAHAKEFTMAQQVTRIEIIPTAGELCSLVLESELIKEKMPVYNRRLRRKTQTVGFKLDEQAGYLVISLARLQLDTESPLSHNSLIGAFPSIAKAKQVLGGLVKKFHLCQKLCHLEQGQGACFSFQLNRCQGACIGNEPAESYNGRILQALEEFQKKSWPYRGPIAIKEHCPVNRITQFLVFNHWRYLGAAKSTEELDSIAKLPLKNGSDHYDIYKILLSYLKNESPQPNLLELI
jgi:DNA polymerase-3 subunit epsilon